MSTFTQPCLALPGESFSFNFTLNWNNWKTEAFFYQFLADTFFQGVGGGVIYPSDDFSGEDVWTLQRSYNAKENHIGSMVSDIHFALSKKIKLLTKLNFIWYGD